MRPHPIRSLVITFHRRIFLALPRGEAEDVTEDAYEATRLALLSNVRPFILLAILLSFNPVH